MKTKKREMTFMEFLDRSDSCRKSRDWAEEEGLDQLPVSQALPLAYKKCVNGSWIMFALAPLFEVSRSPNRLRILVAEALIGLLPSYQERALKKMPAGDRGACRQQFEMYMALAKEAVTGSIKAKRMIRKLSGSIDFWGLGNGRYKEQVLNVYGDIFSVLTQKDPVTVSEAICCSGSDLQQIIEVSAKDDQDRDRLCRRTEKSLANNLREALGTFENLMAVANPKAGAFEIEDYPEEPEDDDFEAEDDDFDGHW